MKLYVIKDPQAYAVITTELAQCNLARRLGAEFKVLDANSVKSGKLDKDSSSDICIMLHAAQAHIAGFSMKDLRRVYPNCKIICLGTDTIWHRRMRHDHEIETPFDVDLWLDTLDEVIDDYNALGINAKRWLWTLSEQTIQYFNTKTNLYKTNDFIGLFKLVSPYRKNLVNYLREKRYSVLHGGMGVGYELDALYRAYATSKYCLGTTSSSWDTGDIRTMKGFRDWIAPCCGTILIYDNHPDVIKNYPCPTYDYNNYQSILDLTNSINDVAYKSILYTQLKWLNEHTLEKQFEEAINEVLR